MFGQRIIYSCIVFLCLSYFHICAQPALDVAGPIKIGNSLDPNPEPGTIRWNGSDLEGWNGIKWVSLTNNVLGTLQDMSGNTYKTLKIGEDRWMIENLRTNFFNDGTSIGNISLSSGWEAATFAAICRYDNSTDNFETYGYLYNGYAATDSRLCPTGWHVSTVEDWTNLIDNYDPFSSAGGSLKETGTNNWSAPNSGATNISGFSALPGGNRKPDGSYVNLNSYGNYWGNGLPLKDYNFRFDKADIGLLTITEMQWGLSVRCVQDRN